MKNPVLETFLSAYIEAALFTCSDEFKDGGTCLDDEATLIAFGYKASLDKNYSREDIAEQALIIMRADSKSFLEKFESRIETSDVRLPGGCSRWEYAGHDFWLTRCEHGAGFWDGDWPGGIAAAMTAYCKKIGNTDLYLGDDGKIYIE